MRFDLTPEQHQRMADEVMREQMQHQSRYQAELDTAARQQVQRSLKRMSTELTRLAATAPASKLWVYGLLNTVLKTEFDRLDSEIATGREVGL